MSQIPKWQYDELRPAGVDYNDSEVVNEYDGKHGRFRDYRKEADSILEGLGLDQDSRVIDMGCGTGAGELVDAIVCVGVLHHLPDLWKIIGLSRLAAMLRPGGRLHLFDIVYSFAAGNHQSELDAWVASIEKQAGTDMAEDAPIHVQDEYSPYDWIMEGLLGRPGFAIEKNKAGGKFAVTYICSV